MAVLQNAAGYELAGSPHNRRRSVGTAAPAQRFTPSTATRPTRATRASTWVWASVYTIRVFEWYPEKSRTNAEERQIPFSKVPVVFEGPLLARRDLRHDYGEERWVAIGLLGHVAVVVVYTKRGHRIRIISARRANRRERERFHARVLAARGR